MIYVISDTHFNHKNIIEYCNRPFKTVDEMNSALIHNWNSIIAPNDTVYFLGDFCLGSKEGFRRITAALNGRKFFVFGNHDRISRSAVVIAGWEEAKYFYDIEYNGQKIRLQHHPDANFDDDTLLIYGHVHDKPAEELPHKSFCACVELHNYIPVSLDYVLEHMELK